MCTFSATIRRFSSSDGWKCLWTSYHLICAENVRIAVIIIDLGTIQISYWLTTNKYQLILAKPHICFWYICWSDICYFIFKKITLCWCERWETLPWKLMNLMFVQVATICTFPQTLYHLIFCSKSVVKGNFVRCFKLFCNKFWKPSTRSLRCYNLSLITSNTKIRTK